MKRTETLLPCGVIMVETTYDRDFTEISLYRPKPQPEGGRKLFTVISRQIVGGKWVVHTETRTRAMLTRVKRDAINWAINYAQKGE